MIQIFRYTEELEKAGFTAEQAKSTVKLWTEFMEDNFATKNDLMDLAHRQEMSTKNLEVKLEQNVSRLDAKIDHNFSQLCAKIDQESAKLSAKIDHDIAKLSSKIDTDISTLSAKINHDMNELRLEVRKLGPELTIKMGIMMATSIGIVSTILIIVK